MKSHCWLMFGSDGLVTEGSTRAGPGLSVNVSGVPIENQMRAPARCGMVIDVAAPPDAFSGMEQSAASGLPVADGEEGY